MITAHKIAQMLESPDPKDPLGIIPCPDVADLRKDGGASVDLRLGTWILEMRQLNIAELDIYSQGQSLEEVGETEVKGHGGDEMSTARMTKLRFVRFGDEFYLHPGQFVLAATLEWVRLPSTLGGYVIGRSSWGRRGLIIATATGVHPGFTGCLTLEMTNVGQVPIKIKPGLPVCQLFLHETKRSLNETPDKSAFVGYRRPVLGTIRVDDFANRLGRGLL